jgi:pimeloyl-ACP methyl ester carboxylesterase
MAINRTLQVVKMNRPLVILTAIAALLSTSTAALSQEEVEPTVPASVVLVHGAFADGSSWAPVIRILQREGLPVVAVQNPLTSFEDDVATTRRALARLDGPIVLVGHSYGGMVITEASEDPDVSALVYVAARAPDVGEDYPALAARFPAPPAGAGIVRADGFAQFSEAAFLSDFAGDIPPDQARVLFAAQGPISETLFSGRTTYAGWREKPTYYAISTADRTTSPELQRYVANRMNAVTIELNSSHLSPVSHPEEIAGLIIEAANQGR